MYLSDMHTHSIASGHGTECTITNMARAAAEKGLRLLGITDHGPGTLAAGTSSYFRSLTYSPKKHFGVELLYGIELNILDRSGTVDLDQELLCKLDYAIASMHAWNYRCGTRAENTEAFINVMRLQGLPGKPARSLRSTKLLLHLMAIVATQEKTVSRSFDAAANMIYRCFFPVTAMARSISEILPVLLSLFIRPCFRNS